MTKTWWPSRDQEPNEYILMKSNTQNINSKQIIKVFHFDFHSNDIN